MIVWDEVFFLSSLVVPVKEDRHMAIGRLGDLDVPRKSQKKETAMTKKPLTEDKVQAMIASDPDAPEATDEQFAHAKPFGEAFPALAEEMRKNVGGRPKSDCPKVAVSLRLDQEIVARFKASGPGWQTRMNDVLRDAVGLDGLP